MNLQKELDTTDVCEFSARHESNGVNQRAAVVEPELGRDRGKAQTVRDGNSAIIAKNAQLAQLLKYTKQRLAAAEADKAKLDETLRKTAIKLAIEERSNECSVIALDAACAANKELSSHLGEVEACRTALMKKFKEQQECLSFAEDNIYQLTEDKFVLSQEKENVQTLYDVLAQQTGQ